LDFEPPRAASGAKAAAHGHVCCWVQKGHAAPLGRVSPLYPERPFGLIGLLEPLGAVLIAVAASPVLAPTGPSGISAPWSLTGAKQAWREPSISAANDPQPTSENRIFGWWFSTATSYCSSR